MPSAATHSAKKCRSCKVFTGIYRQYSPLRRRPTEKVIRLSAYENLIGITGAPFAFTNEKYPIGPSTDCECIMPLCDNSAVGQARVSQNSNKLSSPPRHPAACGRVRPAVVTTALGVMRVSTYLRIIFTKPNTHSSIQELSINRFPTRGHPAEPPRPSDNLRTILC